MKTVAQAFQEFIAGMELRSGEEREAQRQERFVSDAMKKRLGPSRTFLSGSYGRNTAIRPLHDIDLFLVFPAAVGGNGKPASPEDFLRSVLEALEAEFRDKKARFQNRSVNIQFTGTGIGFDVVPALEDPRQRDQYWLPDLKRQGWIQSNPWRHQQICDAANERANKKLKPLIKALKHWNVFMGKLVPSFLLEVMAL